MQNDNRLADQQELKQTISSIKGSRDEEHIKRAIAIMAKIIVEHDAPNPNPNPNQHINISPRPKLKP